MATNYKEWIGEDIEILYKPSVKDAEEADYEEITDKEEVGEEIEDEEEVEEEVEDGYDMDEEDEEYDPDGIDDQETQLLHDYHADQRGSWNRHC